MFKILLIFVFMVGTIWDAITTYFGMIATLGGANATGVVQGMSLVGALMILGLSFNTIRIWRGFRSNPDSSGEIDFILPWILRMFWVAGVVIGFFTSFNVNYGYIPRSDDAEGIGIFAGFIILFITALATMSPMFLGRFWEEKKKQMKAEEKEREEQRKAKGLE